jgi:phosphonate transport system permease protein
MATSTNAEAQADAETQPSTEPETPAAKRQGPKDLPNDLRRLASPLQRPSPGAVAGTAVLIAAVLWSAQGAEFSFGELARGVPAMGDFLARMWPPDFGKIAEIVLLLIETLQMAIMGTLLGALGSLFLSLAAARNVAPRPVYLATRMVLNVLRSIPELVFALMFVTAVGLGPFAGIMALALGVLGTMAKIFAEAIESVDPGPVEAMRAVGAGRAQALRFAVLPQAFPMITSYTLLLWEGNVRHATILGLVGAGGIGLELTMAMRMYDFGHLLAIVFCIIVMVTAIDRLSAFLRARLL